MLSSPDERRVCCSGHLTLSDLPRELPDFDITECHEDLLTMLCSLQDNTHVQHVLQNTVDYANSSLPIVSISKIGNPRDSVYWPKDVIR